MTESDVTAMLRTKYSGQNWAFASQVPDATGLLKGRTCDGMAMGLWPSKGLHLHGFEIKVQRSDWLRELQDQSKALAFSRHCHYWWIVAPKKVVKVEEMPAEWGLQEITSTGALRVKKASSLITRDSVDYCFLAGLFRALARDCPERKAISAARSEGYDAGYRDGRKAGEGHKRHDLERATARFDRLTRDIADFEEASDLKIREYDGRRLGEAVAQVRTVKDVERRMASLRKDVARLNEVFNAPTEDD